MAFVNGWIGLELFRYIDWDLWDGQDMDVDGLGSFRLVGSD